MPRLLLLLPAAGYANPDFIAAAARLGIELVACADHCHRLAPGWGLPPLMSVPFDQPAVALPQVLTALGHAPHPNPDGTSKHSTKPASGQVAAYLPLAGEAARPQPVNAVLAVDDHGQALAAQLRVSLNLPGNAPEAVATLTDKLRFRQLQQAIGLPHPAFAEIGDAGINTGGVPDFPLVVKARRLNASRGVVRADDADQLARALTQVRRIRDRVQRDREDLMIEAFIPGVEVALDGVLSGGVLQVLAVFDKPDPLDGPYFEETLFITPSRLPLATQREFADAVARACVAADVTEGAVHAEARINDAGVWLLEIAPRGIGGLCGRVLDATLGMNSAEIVLRHAVGLPLPTQVDGSAAGVMMIPIPANGILRGVDGLAAARALPHISGIEITAAPGQLVAPPPEGASYLGFIFSRAATPAHAEAALRSAYAALAVRIQPRIDA